MCWYWGCPRQRDQHTECTSCVEEHRGGDPGAGARVGEQGRGRCRAGKTLLTWKRMWVFTLCYGGEPSLDLTHTVNQDSLGCKVLNLRSNQYKPRRNLLAGGTGNSEGWGLLQALWMNILTLHRGGSLFPHVCTPVHWLHFLLPATRDDRWLLQTHECSYLRSEGFPFFRCLHQYPPCQTRSIDWPLL